MAAVFKLACVVLALMVLSAPYEAEGAVTCPTVTQMMAPCLGYLLGGAVSPKCCPNVVSLLAMAKSTPDRQAACGCLKTAAKSMPNLNMAKAAGLPALCKVNIPYKISPTTDCSKVK